MSRVRISTSLEMDLKILVLAAKLGVDMSLPTKEVRAEVAKKALGLVAYLIREQGIGSEIILENETSATRKLITDLSSFDFPLSYLFELRS